MKWLSALVARSPREDKGEFRCIFCFGKDARTIQGGLMCHDCREDPDTEGYR